jgi:hypothetical protein
LYAERCIFGLKNRAVFTEFASFLNTAVEIVEEVTSRNCTHTQDVQYVKCYGIRATSKQEQEKQEAAAAANDGSCVGDYYSGGCGGCWDGSACASWDGSNGYDGVTVNNNHYDYYENADDVEGDDADDADDAGADEEMTSVSQMLAEFDAMRALTATSVVVEDTVKVEVEVEVDQQQQQSEEVELVMTSTAVKEEQKQQEEEKETNKETKGKWFSWF